LDADDGISGLPRPVDLSSLMKPMGDIFPQLNIEGLILHGDAVKFFQRGNKGSKQNAVITVMLPAFLHAMLRGYTPPLSHILVELGELNGIPLSFTDAAALPDGEIMFSAVAEDTDDSYNDGTCAGAAVGLLSGDGKLRWLRPLSEPHKIEGLHAEVDGGDLKLLLVTDADDINVPARLYAARTARDGNA